MAVGSNVKIRGGCLAGVTIACMDRIPGRTPSYARPGSGRLRGDYRRPSQRYGAMENRRRCWESSQSTDKDADRMERRQPLRLSIHGHSEPRCHPRHKLERRRMHPCNPSAGRQKISWVYVAVGCVMFCGCLVGKASAADLRMTQDDEQSVRLPLGHVECVEGAARGQG